MDPEHFVKIRTLPGGPAPEEIGGRLWKDMLRFIEFKLVWNT
ncbi:hypothetical protein [Neobacillus cucumis]|nr:hypothetical protein [Neobacillus cucumis]MBM7651392.1 hypothetical protein [Neobacillus cucumis]